MEQKIPRLLLAGTGSGCGKTTLTCAVLQALTGRGLKTAAFKCGPDYIDPMFHRRITGGKSANLDLFFFRENTARFLLAKNSAGRDVSIIEGVMGYYDGLGLAAPKASAYDLAKTTQTPAVLIVNGKGASLSVLAVIKGFLTLYPDSGIRGILLNRCSAMTYGVLAKEIQARFSIPALGFLPEMPECGLESRHLGLITAAEVLDLDKKLKLLAAQAEKTVDLNGLLALAQTAPPLRYTPVRLPRKEPVRVAVARDRAFSFYYEDNLDAIAEMGGEIVPFRPMDDERLPDNIHGLYLGGGYPELYAEALGGNRPMLCSVRAALDRGLPCIAECGGFMYLTEAIGETPMVGFLPGRCFDSGRLTRFGYVTLRAKGDNLLCKAGEEIPAHEFHRWDCTSPGECFTAQKATGRRWDCAVATDRLYAGFPHFHFYANPAFLEGFYDTCIQYKGACRHAGNAETNGD